MSKPQMLANLQILLNRVRARAAEPRGHGGTGEAAATSPAPVNAAPVNAAPVSASPVNASPVHAPPAIAAAAAPITSAPLEPVTPAPERVVPAAAIAARTATDGVDSSVGTSTWLPPADGADSDVDVDVDVDVEIEVGESLPPEAEEAFAASAVASPAAAPAPEEAPARTESESEERLVAAQPVSPEVAQEFDARSADVERTPSTPPDVVQAVLPSLTSDAAVASGAASGHRADPEEPAAIDALPHDSWSPPSAAPPQPAPQTVPELEMDRGSGSPAIADDTSTTLEAAPASSRRPVEEPEEQLADMAFGTGAPQPPRHTPPPESGRLPAAPPDEFDEVDVTGVRNASALSNEAEAVAARAEPIVPEASRPVLAATNDVAEVVGPPPRFAPKTFADLLEATLSL